MCKRLDVHIKFDVQETQAAIRSPFFILLAFNINLVMKWGPHIFSDLSLLIGGEVPTNRSRSTCVYQCLLGYCIVRVWP